MLIERIDPRDIEWEVDQPVYRVYFWHQPPAPAGVPPERMGYYCDERRVTGATDVHEVVEWARETARPEESFTLYVEHVAGDRGRGLIRLAGTDPTIPV